MTPPAQILAQRPHSSQLQGFFDGLHTALRPDTVGPPAIMLVLGFVAGVVVLLLVMAMIKSRRDAGAQDSQHGHPMKLFCQALRSLGVSWSDRLLMRMIVRKARLQHPAMLLFSPPLLERHAARWTDSLSIAAFRNHARGRLKIVAEKVFS